MRFLGLFFRKRFPAVVAVSGMLVAAGAAAEENEKYSMLIADFERPESAGQFIPMKDNPQKVTWVNDPKLVLDGKGTGRWYVPAAGKGEHQWPRATFNLPENLQTWEAFDQLELDIFNPDPAESRFGINIYDSDGNAYGSHTCAIAPGRSVFRWDLPDAVRERPILRIMLVTGNPVREYTLYLDNIRVSATRESLKKRIDRQLTRLQADWQESLWRRAGMQDRFLAFQSRLLELKNSSAGLAGDLKKFSALRKEYSTAKKHLIAKLCAQGIEEFNRCYPASAVWGYGWTDGLQKVYRKDLPFLGRVGGTPEISLARRETEGVQIVLRSRRDLKNVRLTVGELRNRAGGAVLPVQNIRTAVVGHVKTLPPPYPVERPAEWHPDPLLGYLTQIPLEKDVWQAFFLDVKTDPDTPSGIYEGYITASADDAPDLRIPWKVRVWDFTLPEELSQPRLVNFNTDGNHTIYTEDEKAREEFIRFREGKTTLDRLSPEARRLWELELATRDLLLEHLICPNALYITRRRHKIEEILSWNARRASCYNITYVPPQRVAKGQGYPDWIRRVVLGNLAALVPDLRKHDLMKKSYLYCFDEINDEKFFSAVEILTEIRKLYPDIRIVTTAYDPDFGRSSGLDKVIDCWVPQVERFEEQKELIREVRKSGKKVWYYSCLWDPGMDMLIEKPLTGVRLLTGLNQVRLGSDGFLYYAVNSGQWQHKPIAADTPLTEHNGRGCGKFNGEGLLVYAAKSGPQPSIRLKAFRDGLEDIEYCALLRKLPADKLTPAGRAKREALLKVPVAVITDLEIFDQTGEAVNAWRNEVGAMLEHYTRFLTPEPTEAAAFSTQPVQAASTARAQPETGKRVRPQVGKTLLQIRSYPKVCKLGEKATFTVKALCDGQLINSGSITVRFTNSGGAVLEERTVLFADGNPARLTFSLNEPGIVMAETGELCDAGGNEMTMKSYPRAATGFEPEKIRPVEPVPADFMNFWQGHLKRVAGASVTVAPMPGKTYRHHDAFLLTANMPGKEKFYAVMLVPKTPGKHAVWLGIPGAGPGSGVLWPAENEKDKILVQAHVHRYPPSADREKMRQSLNAFQMDLGMMYCYENASDRERFFYRRVICGLNVIADYLAARSDYDGRNFHVMGSSQGGALSIALTGLNKNVTACAVNVPAMCDHSGWKVGRAPGWPGFHRLGCDATAPYYDSCNFAAFIKVPFFMAVGYVDKIAPPAGGYAAFSQVSGPKEFLPMYTRGHEIPKEFHVKSADFFRRHTR